MALTCRGPAPREEPPRWRLSVAQSWSASDLELDTGETAAFRKRAASVAGEYRLSEAWTLQLGAGVSIDGDLEVEGDRYELDPGFLAVGGGSYRMLDGSGIEPFLVFGLQLGVAGAGTERVDAPVAESATLLGFDARFSLAVGKVLWNGIAPYAAVRAFGGPVLWERRGETTIGSDRYHFQLGAGALATAGAIDAYFEIVPLGERALSVGMATSF